MHFASTLIPLILDCTCKLCARVHAERGMCTRIHVYATSSIIILICWRNKVRVAPKALVSLQKASD